MRVSLKELEVFSQCPARAKFDRDWETPRNLELDIIQSVMKKCYIKSTEYGFRSEWRRIVAWVDKMAFRDIDVAIPDSYKVGKATSEHCLVFLRTWYEALYLKEDVVGYVDVELELAISSHTITGIIPIIKTDGESVQILLLTDTPKDNRQLFNSVEVRGLAMLLSNHLVEEHVSVVHIAIGERGGFKMAELKTKVDDHAKLRQRLVAMTNAMERINSDPYPSIGEQCRSCPHKWRCAL